MSTDDDLTVEQRKLLAEYSSPGFDNRTISLEKIRQVAKEKGEDPDVAVEGAQKGLAKQYPDQIYKIQKWCAKCQHREEAVMYAGDLPTLEKYLDDQTRLHAHPHIVERKITKARGELISDFHRVPY